MALTRKFKETVQLRVKQDPEYRKELIIEATNAFLDGDISTGKTLLRQPDARISLTIREKLTKANQSK